ncbi:xanthine dehydrogenase accessory protein XdhC [uncultured Roseobacter sp.]|uniref:xanthine dehydrogenase accessory protein XdhC n=1 Tax=uncultured Roseobacter sp. TaxID=114847 RepID=UPI002624557D|nr:xanthine dehydrogenase accessory protein XdhC [uncultured Roseobacter sp.]
MSFDLSALQDACALHGRVARVVVAQVRGSAPREVGAAMLVWPDGQAGTIGGGTLEHSATLAARQALSGGAAGISRHALGPDMGQCCGGSVDLLTEVWDSKSVSVLEDDAVIRGPGEPPMAVTRIMRDMRSSGTRPSPRLIGDWMVEPVTRTTRDIWIWGAGHVGRAMVDVLHPLPGFALTWIDTSADRFPAGVSDSIRMLTAENPAALAPYAPSQAEHLILTYSHALDLELCHQLLIRGFGFAGLIGSATKWARFRKRLTALGHTAGRISQITCPIGDPALGKHPYAIATGTAAELLRRRAVADNRLEHTA